MNAKQAKKLTENSRSFQFLIAIEVVYSLIEENAKCGFTKCRYYSENICKNTLLLIKEKLIKDGYSIETQSHYLIISW